jgi:general secretion pathway protein K
MKNERGIVLIMVIWALTVLMVLAIELARTMRVEGLTSETYHEEVETYYLALAGLHRALYAILQAQQEGQSIFNGPGRAAGLQRGLTSENKQKDAQHEKQDIWARGDGRWINEEFGGGGYWVRVVDESGKINLNQVDEATLRQAFVNLKFDVKLSEDLTDAILDWRDPDSLVRMHGAETDDYLGQRIPYPAKDGPFDTLDELLLVRGVSPLLFYGQAGAPALRDLFTVYSAGGVGNAPNLLTANALVIRAILGVDPDMAEDLVRRRSGASATELPGLFSNSGGGNTRGLNLSLPTVVTVDCIGYLGWGGVTRRASAVVQRQGVNGFRFLRWQDRYEGIGAPPPSQG